MSFVAQCQTWMDEILEAACLVEAPSLRLVAVNQSAIKMLGEDAPALLGRDVTEMMLSPEDMVFWDEVRSAHLLDQQVLHSESVVAKADGSMLTVERRVRALPLAQDSATRGVDPPKRYYLWTMLDHSARQETEDKLERLLAEMRATLESTGDGILVTDLRGGIQAFNKLFSKLWQLHPDMLTQRNDAAIYHSMRAQVADQTAYDMRMLKLLDDPLLEDSGILGLKNARMFEYQTLPQFVRGQPIGRVYSFRDITERLASEERLRLAAKVFESSIDAIFVSDSADHIFTSNTTCQRLMERTPDQLHGVALTDLLSLPGNQQGLKAILDGLPVKQRWEGELRYNRADGSQVPLQVSLVHMAGERGGAMHCIGHAHDLTETLADKQRIHDLAFRDSLTGLPNRVMLHERGDHAIAMASRDGHGFALMFIDLDRFKSINDTLGHSFGDMVLKQVAERVKRCLRPYDTMARLGGDEFVVILHQADMRAAEHVGERILEVFTTPFERDDMRFIVTCSIGVSLYPQDGADMSELIKNADDAMYRVKEQGRASLRFYQRQMNVDLLARMKLDHAMRLALQQGAFRLNYQPQVHIPTGAVIGAEALIRWRDPEMGEVSPGRFIPVAEETGFIVAIGDWVMVEAVRQAAVWYAAGMQIPVSVNVSAPQFQQKNFVAKVASALKAEGLPAEMLELELTESILIGDVDSAFLLLRELADLGIRLAIDDFGTGYSSLAYLKRFPIQRLKIDKSFVDKLPDDESDVAITNAVINLGHALKLKVIAEGVETETQRSFLAHAGCDEFQGWLFSKALPPDEFERLVNSMPKHASLLAACPTNARTD